MKSLEITKVEDGKRTEREERKEGRKEGKKEGRKEGYGESERVGI